MGSFQPARASQKPSLQFDTIRLAVDLFERYLENLQIRPARVLVAIAGNTGLTKNTIASMVANHLNRIHAQETGRLDWSFSIRIPMRDLAFPKSQSSDMHEPKSNAVSRLSLTHENVQGFCEFVHALRRPLTNETKTVSWPPSDNAVQDVSTDDIIVEPRSKIILLDGIHGTLEQPPWSELALIMDEVWLVDSDPDGGEMLLNRYAINNVCADGEITRRDAQTVIV